MNISILGGGAWGTALGVHFAKKSYNVKIWEFFDEQAREMQEKRVCPLLPEIKLLDNIAVSSNMEEMLKDTELIFVVVPSNKVEITMQNASKFITTEQSVILCSKGFTENQQLLAQATKNILERNVYCLYGPTLAKEFADGVLAGVVLAGENENLDLKNIIESDAIRVETSTDLIGVQIGAALKNVVTIFVGIVEGMGMGENTKAYIFTKGIEEISKIGVALGARKETFYGLTCMGDLTLKSRNRLLGVEIGKGRKLDDVLAESNHVSEGIIAIQNAMKLKEKLGLDLPLISGLYGILFENKMPKDVLIVI